MNSFALMFPGYGSQHLRMVEDLPNPSRITPYLDAAEAMTGLALSLIEKQGPEQLLANPLAAVPLLVLVEFAWADALAEERLRPAYVTGHGVGEFAALAVSGAITIGAALSLAVARTKMVARVSAGSDGASAIVTGLDPDQVADLIGGPTGPWVSQRNSPRHAVIAGAQSAIDAVTPALLEAGATRVLATDSEGALNTSWMTPAAHEFAALLDQAEFRDAKIPVVPNATGIPTTNGEELRAALIDQLAAPIRWQASLEAIAQGGVGLLVECGPGASLISFGHPSGISVAPISQLGVDGVRARLAI